MTSSSKVCAPRRTHKGASCYGKKTLRRMLNSTADFYVKQAGGMEKIDPMEMEAIVKRFSPTTKFGGIPANWSKTCGNKAAKACGESSRCEIKQRSKKEGGDVCVSLTGYQGKNDHGTESGMLKTLQEAVDENCSSEMKSCEMVIPPKHWVDATIGNKLLSYWAESASLREEMELTFKPYMCSGSSATSSAISADCFNAVLKRYNNTASMRFSGWMIDTNSSTPEEVVKWLDMAWNQGLKSRPRYSKFGYIFVDSASDSRGWNTVIVDRGARRIEHFHPEGDIPVVAEPYLRAISKHITEELDKNHKWESEESRMVHQDPALGGKDRGLYHLWYLTERIGVGSQGKTMAAINKRKTRNEIVLSKEKHFFRPQFDMAKARKAYEEKVKKAEGADDSYASYMPPSEADVDLAIDLASDPNFDLDKDGSLRLMDLTLTLPRDDDDDDTDEDSN